ncbi:MAG TPA: DUF5674 family protein [Anaerolineae bacterium]|nr:DUF5674 family protein [Anaerolineae bacterium]
MATSRSVGQIIILVRPPEGDVSWRFPVDRLYSVASSHVEEKGHMGILIIRKPATRSEIAEMSSEFGAFIKLAVDLEREILAGGGELHADCEEALLQDGSKQEDVWGGDWYPDTREVGFESLINIRPRQDNRGLELQLPRLRQRFETVVRRLLEVTDGS